MSGPKYFRLHKKRDEEKKIAEELGAHAAGLERDIQNIFEDNLETLLDVRLVASEYPFPGGRADIVGLDQNHCPVIIEHKRDVNHRVINQVMDYAEALDNQRRKFEIRVREELGHEAYLHLDWEAGVRAICVAADFVSGDLALLKRTKGLELIRYQLLGTDEILTLEWVESKASPEKGPPPVPPLPPKPPKSGRGKGGRFPFLEAGVPPGSKIVYKDDHTRTAIVKSNAKIEFEGRETSLSGAAAKIQGRETSSGVRGPIWWEFEGETLHERLIRLRSKTDENISSPDNARHQPNERKASKDRQTHPDYGLSEEKVLEREYKGRNYQVSVVPNGFLYEGEFFRALTPIAKKITSYEAISGPDFFGVKREPQNQTERSEMPISGNLQALSDRLQSYLKNLGGDVREIPSPQHTKSGNYIDYQCNGIIFAKLGARPDMVRERWVRVYLNLDPDSVKLIEGFARDMRYRKGESFRTGERRLQLTVRTMDDVERAKPYIHRAYEEGKR